MLVLTQTTACAHTAWGDESCTSTTRLCNTTKPVINYNAAVNVVHGQHQRLGGLAGQCCQLVGRWLDPACFSLVRPWYNSKRRTPRHSLSFKGISRLLHPACPATLSICSGPRRRCCRCGLGCSASRSRPWWRAMNEMVVSAAFCCGRKIIITWRCSPTVPRAPSSTRQ